MMRWLHRSGMVLKRIPPASCCWTQVGVNTGCKNYGNRRTKCKSVIRQSVYREGPGNYRILASCGMPVRLNELSSALKLNSSTTLRFLTTLQNRGYVYQDPSTSKYSLTYKICRLANKLSANMELQSVTHPYLIALTEIFQESACVSVEQNGRDVGAGQNPDGNAEVRQHQSHAQHGQWKAAAELYGGTD